MFFPLPLTSRSIRLVRKVIGAFATATAIFVIGPSTTRADTVNLGAQGTFTTDGPFTVGGITITGSGPLSFSSANFNGFGILGGRRVGANSEIEIISGTEFADFAFVAGAASGVSFRVTAGQSFGPPGTFDIAGFGVGGNPLGVVPRLALLGSSTIDVSALFDNVLLSSFRIQGGPLSDAGVNVYSINFTPSATPSAAPEPGSLALLLPVMGAVGMVIRKRRKK